MLAFRVAAGGFGLGEALFEDPTRVDCFTESAPHLGTPGNRIRQVGLQALLHLSMDRLGFRQPDLESAARGERFGAKRDGFNLTLLQLLAQSGDLRAPVGSRLLERQAALIQMPFERAILRRRFRQLRLSVGQATRECVELRRVAVFGRAAGGFAVGQPSFQHRTRAGFFTEPGFDGGVPGGRFRQRRRGALKRLLMNALGLDQPVLERGPGIERSGFQRGKRCLTLLQPLAQSGDFRTPVPSRVFERRSCLGQLLFGGHMLAHRRCVLCPARIRGGRSMPPSPLRAAGRPHGPRPRRRARRDSMVVRALISSRSRPSRAAYRSAASARSAARRCCDC